MTGFASYVHLLKPQRRPVWSIGIYAGTGPFDLAPHPSIGSRPVLTANSLNGIKADGVADPFMIRCGNDWLMYFEVENRTSGKGEIGLASSRDVVSWRFEGIVLKEPFHLSYPHVWRVDDNYYMLPESGAAGAVRLYKADSFPLHWEFQGELIRGNLVDATPFFHAGRWWIMALEGFRRQDAFVIYHAERLEGPWQPHSRNPISSNNRRTARPAGRMIDCQGALIRVAQDDEEYYGRIVRALVVEELTPTTYVERPLEGKPMLGPSGTGWNATGMHHVDAHEIGSSEWIACVDGRRTVRRWPVVDRAMSRFRGVAPAPRRP